MKNKIRILILSDSLGKVSQIRKELNKAGLDFKFKSAKTEISFKKNVSVFKPDLIISNISSKSFDIYSAFKIARSRIENDIPFVCITNTASSKQIASLEKHNADHFMMIKDLDSLDSAIKSALEKRHSELEKTLRLRNNFIETVLDNLPIGLAVNTIDDGKLQYMNSKFEEIYGWPKDILTSVDSFFKHVYPDPKYRRRIKQRVLSDIKSGDPSCMVWENAKIVGKDGRQKVITAINIPLPEQNLMISTVQDVTARWEAEEKIKESENRFQTALQNSPIILAHTDKKLRYKWISNSHSDFESAKIIGRRDDEIAESNGAKELFKLKRRVLRSGKGERKEITFELRDGNKIHDIAAEPLLNASGEIIGVSTAAMDITEQKSIQEQINMLAHAVKSISECVSITDMNDKILFVNKAFLDTYGYEEDELIGKSIRMARSDHNHSKVEKEILPATLKGGWEGELWNRKKDGTDFPVHLTTSVIRDDNDKPVALIGVAKEIAEQKKAEKALRDSERKFKTLFNAASEAIFLMKGDRFVDCNPKTLTMYGCKRDEIIGKTPFDFSPTGQPDGKDSREKGLEKLSRALQGDPEIFEWKHKRPDGMLFDAEVNLSRLEIRGEQYVQAIVRDITERKKAEEELIRKTELTIRHQASLLELAKIDTSDLEGALEKICEIDAKTLEVERVSVWFFNTDLTEIHCRKLYILSKNKVEEGIKLQAASYPGYFKALEESRTIAAIDAQSDPRINEFKNEYLKPNKITSMMDIPVWRHGKVAGIVCHEHVGPKREWSFEEQEFGASAADIVSLSLEAYNRQETERALRLSENKYRNIFEQSKDIIFISTPEGKILDINPAGIELLAYPSKEELLKVNIATELYVNPDAREVFQKEMQTEGYVKDFESELKRKDGKKITVLETVTADYDSAGNIIAYHGVMRDVTRQKVLEQQLLHAQKMEAMGTLAGGIAHDFNNILSAILGYAEITRDGFEEGSTTRRNLDQIFKAGIRAKELVAQILTFSRKTKHGLQPVQIDEVVKEALKLLRASLPVTVDIQESLAKSCGTVMANPTQIHQVVMNLCTNAYDAMREEGGVLGVTLSPIKIDRAPVEENPGLQRGDYIKLSISDTGHGMDSEIIQRIFDPFFTTKAAGSGTGMGLSVVHGIVESHKGSISVWSEPGKGSIFDVYLPAYIDSTIVEEEIPGTIPTGTERILFVDDENAIVQTGQQILERLGYQVTATTSSIEALKLFRAKPDQVDLVITDQTMPKFTGADLAKELINIQPSIPIIMITGFSDVVTPEKAKQIGIREYAQKPLSMVSLAKTIRKVLDGRAKDT